MIFLYFCIVLSCIIIVFISSFVYNRVELLSMVLAYDNIKEKQRMSYVLKLLSLYKNRTRNKTF